MGQVDQQCYTRAGTTKHGLGLFVVITASHVCVLVGGWVGVCQEKPGGWVVGKGARAV